MLKIRKEYDTCKSSGGDGSRALNKKEGAGLGLMGEEELKNNGLQEEVEDGEKERRAKRKKRKRTVLVFGLVFLLWAGVVYGGYYFATKQLQETKLHFSQQIDELKQENRRIEEDLVAIMGLLQDELEVSGKELADIMGEMETIQEELELAGETLTGADETRESLQGQISRLDDQLSELQKQIDKLEEAARAF